MSSYASIRFTFTAALDPAAYVQLAVSQIGEVSILIPESAVELRSAANQFTLSSNTTTQAALFAEAVNADKGEAPIIATASGNTVTISATIAGCKIITYGMTGAWTPEVEVIPESSDLTITLSQATTNPTDNIGVQLTLTTLRYYPFELYYAGDTDVVNGQGVSTLLKTIASAADLSFNFDRLAVDTPRRLVLRKMSRSGLFVDMQSVVDVPTVAKFTIASVTATQTDATPIITRQHPTSGNADVVPAVIFSIDQANWQAAPFTGLTANTAYTMYARDEYGATAELGFMTKIYVETVLDKRMSCTGLTILVNSVPLVLPEDMTIRVEINTPYFDTDAVAASVVWHFDVPINGNEEQFNYVHLLPVVDKNKKYSVQIVVNGFSIGRGTMLCTNCTAKDYRVVITLNTFYEAYNGVTLNQAPYPDVKIGGTPHSQIAVVAHVSWVNDGMAADYKFPMVYAPAFYGDDNDNNKPQYNPAYTRYINHYLNGGMTMNNANVSQNTVVPMPMLMPVLKKVAELKGYTLTGSILEHDELSKLLMLSRVTIDDFDYDYYANVGLLGGSLPPGYGHLIYNIFDRDYHIDEYSCMFNGYYTVKDSGNYIIHCGGWAKCSEVYGTNWMPEMAVFKNGVCIYSQTTPWEESFFLGHVNGTSLDYNGEFLKDDVIDIRLRCWAILLECYIPIIPFSGYVSIKRTNSTQTNFYQNYLNLSDHIPAKSVLTVFNNVRNLFFGAMFFDDDFNNIELCFLDDILDNNGCVDITRHIIVDENESEMNQAFLPEIKYTDVEKLSDIADKKLIKKYGYAGDLEALPRQSYALLGRTNGVYEFSTSDESKNATWKYYGHNFQPYKAATSSTDLNNVSLDLGVVPVYEQDAIPYPYTTVKGVSQMVPNEEDEPELQLFFWRGMQNGRPVAVPVDYIEGDTKVGDMTLDLNAVNGVVNKFGRRWLSWMSNYELITERLTDVDIWLMADLMSLIKPKSKKRWLMIDNVKCLPKQMSFIINVRGDIQECEIIAAKSNVR